MGKNENITVRTVKKSDMEAIRELWRICFGDSEAFMDWFFCERFFPDYSACLLEEGSLVSAMQSYPLHIGIRGRILPALMLAGVSTLPSCSGRGYMREVFSHFMQLARKAQFPAIVHTPANIPTFRTREHLPATRTLYMTYEGEHADYTVKEVTAHSMYDELAPLHICYSVFSGKYSGCVSRSIADFYYKFRDYASDGAVCLTYSPANDIQGYCVYYALDDKLHCEEFVCLNQEAQDGLLKALISKAEGRKLSVKLPPDSSADIPGAKYELKPQGVMGIADASVMLSQIIGRGEYVFKLSDSTVPQNEGIWNGLGELSNRKPQIELSVGHLGQLLCGYMSIQKLTGDIIIHDKEAANELGLLLPKLNCFIIDEY